MRIIFKGARLYFPTSPLHLSTIDVLVVDGICARMASGISEADAQVYNADGMYLSPGFLDLFAHFQSPGAEHKETLETGTAAALAGGYTQVMLLPDNDPATDTASQVRYFTNAQLPIDLLPLGAISKSVKGTELAEMYDMAGAGAVAFTDGLHPIQEPGLLLKALQYVKALDKTILQLPRTLSLSRHGLVHEGVMSTRLGLPGMPALAEELMIQRDIELLRYTTSRLHITGVSTKKGLEYIRAAKEEGLHISASIAPYQLFFTDEALSQYDTNLKLYPPLREEADRQALLAGLRDGTIDGVASHHLPQSWDDKEKEFEYAAEGMIGLQTAFPLLCSAIGIEKAIDVLAFGNRHIFELPIPTIEEGAPASFVLTDPSKKFELTSQNNKSASSNSPFFNNELTGAVAGVFHKGQWHVND